jgi:hypothetical protein
MRIDISDGIKPQEIPSSQVPRGKYGHFLFIGALHRGPWVPGASGTSDVKFTVHEERISMLRRSTGLRRELAETHCDSIDSQV